MVRFLHAFLVLSFLFMDQIHNPFLSYIADSTENWTLNIEDGILNFALSFTAVLIFRIVFKKKLQCANSVGPFLYKTKLYVHFILYATWKSHNFMSRYYVLSFYSMFTSIKLLWMNECIMYAMTRSLTQMPIAQRWCRHCQTDKMGGGRRDEYRA